MLIKAFVIRKLVFYQLNVIFNTSKACAPAWHIKGKNMEETTAVKLFVTQSVSMASAMLPLARASAFPDSTGQTVQ